MRSGSKKARLLEMIAARGWTRVGEAEWKALVAAIPKLTAADLRDVGIPVDAPWCGVLQRTFAELESSLCALASIYTERNDLRRFCRMQVIRAKDGARWASRNGRVGEERRAMKAEMVEWMLVWLGDPALFRPWVEIYKTKLGGSWGGVWDYKTNWVRIGGEESTGESACRTRFTERIRPRLRS